MTSEHHVIGTVPAHDSARFVSRVDAVHTTHFRTGAPEYWLEVHTYRNFEDARLDRAGWLALRDLCQRVVDEMEGDDGRPIDGKDAGDLGEGLVEVARLLTVAQERVAALAVLDRLVRMPRTSLVEVTEGTEGIFAYLWERLDTDEPKEAGTGPTVAAALLALEARLEGQNCPERDERFSHE